MTKRAQTENDAGFTLVEVLVALSVFAIAGVALMQLNSEQTRSAGILGKRFIADVEANNQIAESFLLNPEALIPGTTSGATTQRGQALNWTRTIEETQQNGVVRINVNVIDPATAQMLTSLTVLREVPQT